MFQRNYVNRPKEIAEALRRLAEDINTLADVELPTAAVRLSVQFCSWEGTDEQRRAAVDRLTTLLLGTPGATTQMCDGSWQHSTPYDKQRSRGDGITVDVFTALPAKDGER